MKVVFTAMAMLALTAAASTLEVVADGERTGFCVTFQDPEPELRGNGAFAISYALGIEATKPDGTKETFFTPFVEPTQSASGMLMLFHVEDRIWPLGTKFAFSLYDRDGNALSDGLKKQEPSVRFLTNTASTRANPSWRRPLPRLRRTVRRKTVVHTMR